MYNSFFFFGVNLFSWSYSPFAINRCLSIKQNLSAHFLGRHISNTLLPPTLLYSRKVIYKICLWKSEIYLYITKWPIKILFLEAILCYGTVLNLVNLVRNEVLARYFNVFFIIWSFFFFLPRSPVTRFIFLLFLREKKETVILVKGFRIKKNYILSKSNACKPWVLMRLVKIRK